MEMESDIEYYQRRADEELDLAVRADDPIVAMVHQRLSDLYLQKLLALSGDPRAESDPGGTRR